MRTGSKKGGFTLIEVMFSLIIFMVSLTGLVMLQRVSTQGAQKGKEHTAAVNVASFFITQLQNEISNWWAETVDLPANRYNLLGNAMPDPDPAGWQVLGTRVGEFLYHDELDNSSSRFCVAYRIYPLDGTAENSSLPRMVWEIRVRVSWTKLGQFESDWTDCTQATDRIDDGIDEVVELVAIATREFAQ
ncbi:MAG: hypothetical protein GY847_02290 [Proteobacteria bacterium]|nr:hypothetical protein [Pseudomonadota bacterium]